MTPEDSTLTNEDGSERERLRAAYLAARQEPADADWAEHALVTMVFAGVQIDVAEESLLDAVVLVRDSGEGPEDLYGPARDWAHHQVEAMQSEGLDAFDDPLLMGPRDAAVFTLGGAAVLSAVLMASNLLDLLPGREVGDLTAGLALMPLLLSAAIITLICVYKRASRCFPFPVTAVLSALTLAICSTIVALIIMPLGQTGPRANGWWAALLIPGYGILCWITAKLWRGPSTVPAPVTVPTILDAGEIADTEWLNRARAALRERGEMSDRRISTVLHEAEDHARDEGRTLVAEFASPEGYARSLPRDPTVKSRRMTLVYGTLTLLWLALGASVAATADELQPWRLLTFVILVLLCAWEAARHARRWREATIPEEHAWRGRES
ncbi:MULTISPECIES: hypothetical protein [unclassified Brachybacterium]|uniref:hypothetical protein n=1 Tax=unclassified Brachybacterium TaxID=2623841 RepID=UPI004033B7D3